MIIVKVTQELLESPAIYQVKRFPAVIGRSLKCHIHIDHPEISKEHLILKREGTSYRLEDLGSTNHFNTHGKTLQALDFNENTRVQLGDLRIEFLIEEELEKTIEIPRKSAFNRGLALSTTLYSFVLMLIFGLEPLFHAGRDKGLADYLFNAFLLCVASFLTATLLSTAVKIHTGHYRFSRLLHLVFQCVIAVSVFLLIDDVLLFHLSYRWLQILLFISMVSALSFFCAFKMLKLFYPHQSLKKLSLYSSLLVIYLVGGVSISHLFSHRNDAKYRYFGFISYPLWEGRSHASGMKTLEHDLSKSVQIVENYRQETLEKEKSESLSQ